MTRNHLALCLVGLAAFACQQKPAETTPPPPPAAMPAAAASVATEPTVAQRFSPIFSGYWVSTDYLKEVARTRSPAASFDQAASPASLAISPFTSQKDSVEIGASYGLHEGGSLTLLLQPTAQSGTLSIRTMPYRNNDDTADELAYQITATDTTLFFITRNIKTHQIVSKADYRRTGIPGKEADIEAGVERGVNNLLLTGRYDGVDSIGQPVHAQFFTNGLVKGLPFRKYSIQTDFTGPNPGDEVDFDVNTNQQQVAAAFGASFGRDTLKLYIIHSTVGVLPGETDTTEIFTRGRLCYQLIRVRKP